MTTSNTNTTTRFFNVHTEAMGYLNDFKVINGEKGQFTVVTFAMIEGSSESSESVYVSCKISCSKTLALLQQHSNAINNGDIKVFAGLRVAKLRAKPFQYGPQSQKAGQLGVNYSANIIKAYYLKVADQEVFIPKESAVPTTDYGVPSPAAQVKPAVQAVPQVTTMVPTEQQAQDLPLSVKLEKSDPHFQATKQRLKGSGYWWNGQTFMWQLKNVVVNPNSPTVSARVAELQREGYTTEDNINWTVFIPSKTAQSNATGYQRSAGQSAH